MTNKAKWFSLAEALESYKPAEVATAIERDGIWVVDRFGRKINAGDSEASDAYSRQFALEPVSARHGDRLCVDGLKYANGSEYSWILLFHCCFSYALRVCFYRLPKWIF